MSRGVASYAFNLTAFPAAWSIARAYRTNNLSNPLDWFEANRLPGDVQTLVDVFETYVTHDAGLASLSSWVLEDLARGEAHMIDTETDSSWALILLWAIRRAASDSGRERIAIGPNTYATRRSLFLALDDIQARQTDVARDLRLRDLGDRVLPEIRQALQQAIDDHETRERTEIVSAELDEDIVRRLSAAVGGRWLQGFPRVLLSEEGAVRYRTRIGGDETQFGLSVTAPKIFFIDRPDVIGDSPERIGEDLARALNQGEAAVLAEQLARVAPKRYRGDLASRVRQAMKGTRTRPTHCFIPYDWRLYQELTRITDSQVMGRGDFELDGVRFISWAEWQDRSLVFLHLPDAVGLDQFLNEDGSKGVRVSYEVVPPVPGDATGAVPDPIVRIRAFERWRVRVRPSFIRRVPLPESDPVS